MINIASALLPLVFPLTVNSVHSCQFNLKLIHSYSPGFVCCKVPLSDYLSLIAL